MVNICGGATAAFSNQPSKYIARGIFLVHKVPQTLDGAILFANSKEAEGGRKRAQKMKLLANIKAQSRDGPCVFIIVKDRGHVVAKYTSPKNAEKAFYASNMLNGMASRVGGIDLFGANFSAFVGSRNEFVDLPMTHDHADRLATLRDNRLLDICSTEVVLTRGETILPFPNICSVEAYSKMKENKHLNITINRNKVNPATLKSAGARGFPVSKQSRGALQASWFLKEGSRLVHYRKAKESRAWEYIYFEKMQDGHYYEVEDRDLLDGSTTAPTAMTAPTAGGTLAGMTAITAPTKVNIIDLSVTSTATATKKPAPTKVDIIDLSVTSTTTATKKKKRSTIASAKKRKATTTSAKKGKVTAKAVLSEDEESGSYSPSDGSDSEVEEITAFLPARARSGRARSGRASSRVATKKETYVESDQEISDECEGDFD